MWENSQCEAPENSQSLRPVRDTNTIWSVWLECSNCLFHFFVTPQCTELTCTVVCQRLSVQNSTSMLNGVSSCWFGHFLWGFLACATFPTSFLVIFIADRYPRASISGVPIIIRALPAIHQYHRQTAGIDDSLRLLSGLWPSVPTLVFNSAYTG